MPLNGTAAQRAPYSSSAGPLSASVRLVKGVMGGGGAHPSPGVQACTGWHSIPISASRPERVPSLLAPQPPRPLILGVMEGPAGQRRAKRVFLLPLGATLHRREAVLESQATLVELPTDEPGEAEGEEDECAGFGDG